jgi:hypothetical protein
MKQPGTYLASFFATCENNVQVMMDFAEVIVSRGKGEVSEMVVGENCDGSRE